jgi:methyltransferase, FkbM family
MINRIKQAFSKFLFCWEISGDVSSFLELLLNTKKYKWNKNNLISLSRRRIDTPVKYNFKINKKSREVYLRTYAGDIDIFYEIFWKKVYKFSHTRQPRTIIDLGANVGLASLFFISEFPSCKIYAVEPVQDNVDVLKKNLAKQVIDKQVIIIEAAVSDNDNYMSLNAPALKYNFKLSDIANDTDIKIKVLSMDSLFKNYSHEEIDLLKIDIEGEEEKIFFSNTGWLTRVKEIIVEVHSEKANEICRNALENKFNLEKRSSTIFYWSKI